MLGTTTSRKAFSLVELVIVIVIMGVIAAIAVPRVSRGASDAAESALLADLRALRNALGIYSAEHDGAYPSDADATFILQMTTYTNSAGGTNASRTTAYKYGPYLTAVPKCPAGDGKGFSKVSSTSGTGVGWVYDKVNGTINANGGPTAKDTRGVLLREL